MPAYLDHNASTPLLLQAREAMLRWLDSPDAHANPSSTHRAGQQARSAIEGAREALARLISARAKDIVFCSGGTESDNLALFGTTAPGDRVLLGATEHPAVLKAAALLREAGRTVELVPVLADGTVNLEALDALLMQPTRLLSLMHANNETGVLHPIEEAARRAHAAGVLLHCDAAQTFGRLPVDWAIFPADLLSATGHKFGGPRGAGFLLLRGNLKLRPLLRGGEQEQGLRPGTEDTAAILGLAAAADVALQQAGELSARLEPLRDRLQAGLLQFFPGLRVNGLGAPRVANTLSVCFEGLDSDAIILGLDREGVQVSAGSACAAGAVETSHVLAAMGVRAQEAKGALRFSLGRGSTAEDVESALSATQRVVGALRAALG